MTPQELVALLLHKSEKEGRHVLQTHVPLLGDAATMFLVELIKREADRQWIKNPQVSFIMAGNLLAIGDITRSKAVHALGLIARADALRRMDRNEEALHKKKK